LLIGPGHGTFAVPTCKRIEVRAESGTPSVPGGSTRHSRMGAYRRHCSRKRSSAERGPRPILPVVVVGSHEMSRICAINLGAAAHDGRVMTAHVKDGSMDANAGSPTMSMFQCPRTRLIASG